MSEIEEKLLIVSPSPHIRSGLTIPKLMYGVIIALMPAFLFSVYLFGIGAIIVTFASVVSCVFFEYIITRYLLKRNAEINDGSAIVTGVLLAFNVPSNLPWWLVVMGSLVAIGIAKMTFGGLGNNPFNPALVGRVFLLVSFPVQMTSWPVAFASRLKYMDAVTAATPLGLIKEGLKNGDSLVSLMAKLPSHLDIFLGREPGSIGEVSAILLIIGFIYMLYKKIITWHIPVTVIATMFVFSGILWISNPTKFTDPVFQIQSGGAMLGAIFMATDYVTSPMTIRGMYIFGIGIGIITILIRDFGSYPEGVSFAILIMNAFVPVINKYVKPKRFGEVLKNG